MMFAAAPPPLRETPATAKRFWERKSFAVSDKDGID
jgi:hypothetical protein